MKIILAGGGSGGPVTPLLAVAEQLKKTNLGAEFLFVGTHTGPEKAMVQEAGLKFVSIESARWRRYFSVQNFFDIFRLVFAFFQSWKILGQFKPDLLFSAGGFVAVPLAWAAKLKGIKILIHQQDVIPGLANKLVEPFASGITTAFEDGTKNFYSGSGMFKSSKAKLLEWVGNPVREEFFNDDLPYKSFFNLTDQLPILLVVGGGTGAAYINAVVAESLPELVKSHQVVHVTGRGKAVQVKPNENYRQYEFLDKELPTIMKMAHMVVSRAGLGTISELSALGKVSIVVPMPGSHQEANAEILYERKAAVVLDEEDFTPDNLIKVVTAIKFNVDQQKSLSENISKLMPRNAAQRIADIINQLINAR